ncbi:MAG: hypothetical protein V3W35_06935, partial [Gemmatimonadota bacterium]
MIASLVVVQCLLQAAQTPPRPDQAVQTPVLEFPEAGLDDPAAYEGYATRFFRDSHGNAFQLYLDTRSGRVVHVWADAANESAAFTVRDTAGRPAPVVWGGPGAEAESDGRRRVMRHRLAAEVGSLEIGWFLLGTMRQERDFQYADWQRRPYGDPPFVLSELTNLISSLERLPSRERARHLSLLDARDLEELRSRLEPRVTLSQDDAVWSVIVEHTSLDGRNHLTLELRGDPRASTATLSDDRVSLRARSGGRIELDITVTTDGDALTPLGRERLFHNAFEDYYARQRRAADSLSRTLAADEAARDPRLTAFRRFERQVRGLELLSSEEKLMASMPNYATYFGRDQMISALMLEPISSVDLQELVIGSVLRKLDPSGNVSHEEALGGQAIRENAAEYSALIRAWEEERRSDPAAAAERLARARHVLESLQAVRENYRMVDDDFELPVLVDRYLSRSDVPAERKRRFLTQPHVLGQTRLDALMRNLALVAELARPYAEQPTATNLVGFFHRDDEGWLPGSWRDSRAGYGNGRFAMDVNVVWVPKALQASERILEAVNALGLSVEDAVSRVPVDASALEVYLRDPGTLRAAISTWRGARRHFEVRLEPDAIRRRVERSLEPLSGPEREFWQRRLDEEGAARRPLSFLALSLDVEGRPIPAANTDPATDLFLEDYTGEILRETADPAAVLQMLDVFVRPYPVGLFAEGLGPLVVNDAYASAAVQQRFRDDPYHSPRVVWGREVNLLLLGLARQIEAAYGTSGRLRNESDAVRSYVEALRRILETTRQAVETSGLRDNELWSYRIDAGTLRPVRYGTSSDIQLWNLTDLTV